MGKTSIEVSEIWKFGAAIGISCAISVFGGWLTDSGKYITADAVKQIIADKNAVIENDIRHYSLALAELKVVVENNNKVMQEIKEELVLFRKKNELSLTHNE